MVGALPPVSTFVTGYRIYSYVGLIPEDLRFEPNPREVENVLLEQKFAKDPKKTVAVVLQESGATAKAFVRFRVGS